MALSTEQKNMIETLRQFPAAVAAAIEGLTDQQLDALTIDGEWTIRQVVHHLADSHMNSFIRLKLILTETQPQLKPYHQEAWATLPDTAGMPPEASLSILQGLHQRWVALFENLSKEDWPRTGYHPEIGDVSPADLLVIYERHCREHLEQINRLLAAGTQ